MEKLVFLNISFDIEFHNVHLRLTYDTFNSFNNMSSTYNIWYVVFIVYNSPPCMVYKTTKCLSLFISRPIVSKITNMNIFLQLIDELDHLWHEGVHTFYFIENIIFCCVLLYFRSFMTYKVTHIYMRNIKYKLTSKLLK